MSDVDSRAIAAPVPLRRTRRLVFALLVAATTSLGLWTMFRILHVGGLTPLELVILGLFAVTFGWIAIAFWSGIIGFALTLTGRDPLSLAKRRRPNRPRMCIRVPYWSCRSTTRMSSEWPPVSRPPAGTCPLSPKHDTSRPSCSATAPTPRRSPENAPPWPHCSIASPTIASSTTATATAMPVARPAISVTSASAGEDTTISCWCSTPTA